MGEEEHGESRTEIVEDRADEKIDMRRQAIGYSRGRRICRFHAAIFVLKRRGAPCYIEGHGLRLPSILGGNRVMSLQIAELVLEPAM